MARTIKDSRLESRGARDRLKPNRKPYWKCLEPGRLHIGYRRRHKDEPGSWIARRYVGQDEGGQGRYREVTLGLADDFQDADGKTVLSYADAQRSALGDDMVVVARGRLTVADALSYYFAKRRAEGMVTALSDDAQKRAKHHIMPTLGHMMITELTTHKLTAWRDDLASAPALYRGGGVRKSTDRARRHTANKSVTILKAALNRCFADGLADRDTEWKRLKPYDKVNVSREACLTVDEALRLINAADPASGFRDLVHAALLTGARYGELCKLRVKDFDGAKIAVRESKSGKPRHIRLTDEGVEFFRSLTIGRRANDLVLINRRLGREWRKSEQSRPMKAAVKAARVTPISFHQLRHTWASLSVMGGMPLLVVSHNLGHRDTRMVERHYGHLSESYMDEAIRESAPRFGAVTPSRLVKIRKG
jgi:integrase